MTWLQTASGRAFDLLRPDWREVDFEVDIPEALARLARFTGHIRPGPYSVAQHCVIGADAVMRETADREAAAAFLLHDAHEAYLGDIATPIAAALAEETAVAGAFAEIGPSVFRTALRILKLRLDKAVYQAAGMGCEGCPAQWQQLVHRFDLAMLATERRHLLGKSPQPWAAAVEAVQPLRLVGGLTVWPWPKAADEFRERLRRYLPERFGTPRPQPKAGPRKSAQRSAARRIPLEA